MLLPAGVLGISAVLSTLRMEASPTSQIEHRQSSSVAERLKEIRAEISGIDFEQQESPDPNVTLLATWPNFHFGWGNGGWHNGGWGNGGWHNWHNFWHNW